MLGCLVYLVNNKFFVSCALPSLCIFHYLLGGGLNFSRLPRLLLVRRENEKAHESLSKIIRKVILIFLLRYKMWPPGIENGQIFEFSVDGEQ